MKKYILLFLLYFTIIPVVAQSPWTITAVNPLEGSYFGETVSNGILGLKSSRLPLINDGVMLANTYDRDAKENIDTYFDNIKFLNLGLAVDGETIGSEGLSSY
ncbi:MAG: hypothetical protein ACOYJF_12185, partial [Prevotella sp.]